MKILLIPSWYTTDEKPLAGIFFKEYAESLVKYGHEVAVLYIDIRRGVSKDLRGITAKSVNGVKEFRYSNVNYTPGIAAGVNWQKRVHLRKMFNVLEEQFGVPDVIHLESCDAVYLAQKARERWEIPFVYTEHLSNLVSGNGSAYYEKMFQKAVFSADACIAISSVFWNKMNKLRNSEIYRIPNGIAVERLVQSIPGKIFTVKALGALRAIKGYDVLIHAFNEFAKGKCDVKLVIGGEGAERSHLEKIICTLHCQECIVLEGSIERKEVPHFYEDCSVFVCSSQIETFSIVTAEALCSGVPVVATKCGGPEDMINESNGLLVNVGDAEHMAKALETIYNRIDLYDRKKISAEAMGGFNYKSIVNQHERLYEKVKNGYRKNR